MKSSLQPGTTNFRPPNPHRDVAVINPQGAKPDSPLNAATVLDRVTHRRPQRARSDDSGIEMNEQMVQALSAIAAEPTSEI
jgi:hypothetical protein